MNFRPSWGADRVHPGFDVGHRVAADSGCVNVAKVGEVHQIVDHQRGRALDRIGRVLVRPVKRVVVPGIGDDGRWVGFGRVANPDPEECILLD